MEVVAVNNQTELPITSNQSVLQDTASLSKATTAIITASSSSSSSSSDEIASRNNANKKIKKRDRSPTNSDETNTSNNNNRSLVLSQNQQQPQQQQQLAPVSTNLPAPSANNLTIIKKEKQRPETWNKIEQQIFFNALRQNGKNFESITQYFNARQKRYRLENHDGTSIQRSKEQIRHFYYRTWHKIIKYISVPMLNTSKSNQNNNNISSNHKIIMSDTTAYSLRDIQVKCLIAYNTLMNKSHRWNKKSALKLVELINQGWTTIREKGKITRLRMPLCKVSSKSLGATTALTESVSNNNNNHLNHSNGVNHLNSHHQFNSNNTTNSQNKDNSTSAPNVNLLYPRTIQIRLEPRNEHSYCKVHRLAQNPYLNIEIETLQSVKFLLDFLETKWKDRRTQFLEKFQIDTKKPKTASNESDSELANKKLSSNSTTSTYFQSSEKLIIYPSESHQIVSSLDFYESTSPLSSSPVLNLYDEQKSEPSLVSATPDDANSNNNNQKFIENEDETMMIDDYALIAANRIKKQITPPTSTTLSSHATTTITTSASLTQATATSSKKINLYHLNSSQLRSGLTCYTSHLTSSVTRENKDLTFLQVYYALNKPDLIKLEYDWTSNAKLNALSTSSAGESTITESAFPIASTSLIYNQNQRQRFYIDTLASVAASFLKDLQTQQNTKVSTNSSLASSAQAASTSTQQKTPPKQASQPANLNNNNNNNTQSIAIIQPPTSGGETASNQTKSTTTTHILPLDTVLQRLNEEQAQKTKKLLADLNQTKRRSRHRKQIMVVNTSNSSSIRNVILPKLNFLTATTNQQINLDLGDNNQQQQQNIVLSGPVAAVARQIVNTSNSLSNNSNNNNSNNNNNMIASSLQNVSNLANLNTYTHSNNNNLAAQPAMFSSASDNFIILNSFQTQVDQTPGQSSIESFDSNTNYSNLMPQFLASLTSIAIENSNSSSSNNNMNNNDTPSGGLNNNAAAAVVTTPGDNVLSGGNNDTMVGSPQALADMSLLDLSINNTDSLFGPPLKSLTKSNETVSDEIHATGAFSGVSLLKFDKSNNKSSSNLLGNYGLTKQRSDIIVEWTDSMNDVSLTGILNEFQSPDKHQSQNARSSSSSTALVHVLNENSRDSIFFSMDTIMDINNHTSI